LVFIKATFFEPRGSSSGQTLSLRDFTQHMNTQLSTNNFISI